MPESFDNLLLQIAETAGSAVHPAGSAAARERGRQRAVRARVAASVLSVLMLGGVGGIVLVLASHHSGAPAPITHTGTPTPPASSAPASPSPSAGNSSPSSSPSLSSSASAPPSGTVGDLNTIVPGAWTAVGEFPVSGLEWAANLSRPAIHTADRQWFYSCHGTGTLAHLGASGYQELSYAAKYPGSSDSADQVMFFFPSTGAAAQALTTIQSDYANCPEQTTGTDGKAMTGTVRQTEELDGSYAWLHTYQSATGAPASPADIPADNHEYFVQRGDVVELVWLGGDESITDQSADLGFLNSLNDSLCVYGGKCGSTTQLFTVTAVPAGSTSLALGGNPVQVDVSVTNNTDDTLRNVTPIVSLGHCSCVNTPVPMMPNGELQLWDASTNAWKTVPYDREGSGMDYVLSSGVIQIPGFDLPAGQSVSFQFRVRLNPAKEQPQLSAPYRMTNGTSSIDVTLVHPGTMNGSASVPNVQLGKSPSATLPVTVTVN